jgi:hypothetical protein
MPCAFPHFVKVVLIIKSPLTIKIYKVYPKSKLKIAEVQNNFGKRYIKSSKIYFTDMGLACRLLGIRTADELIGRAARWQARGFVRDQRIYF